MLGRSMCAQLPLAGSTGCRRVGRFMAVWLLFAAYAFVYGLGPFSTVFGCTKHSLIEETAGNCELPTRWNDFAALII